MKRDDCAASRREIDDSLGGISALSPASAAHLRICEACVAYAGLVASLASSQEGQAADWRAADGALREAVGIMTARRDARDLAGFVFLAAAAMAGWAWVGMAGGGGTLLALQALAFLTLPFASLASISIRRKGAPS